MNRNFQVNAKKEDNEKYIYKVRGMYVGRKKRVDMNRQESSSHIYSVWIGDIEENEILTSGWSQFKQLLIWIYFALLFIISFSMTTF